MYSDAITAIVAALFPATVLLIVAAKCGWWTRLRRSTTHWQRALAVVAFGLVVGYGGDKPRPQPSGRVLQLVTVLNDGTLLDRGGTLVSGAQATALEQFASEVGQIADATAAVVESARLACVEITNQVAQSDYAAAYIGYDFPRGTPADPNHNIMVAFERVEQTATNIDALVWFSDPTATNVNIRLQYSVAEGQWTAMAATTNFWPATEKVNGVDCVRYRYAMPAGIAGTPLKPAYEVKFGGYAPAEYLLVPAEGVTVTVGETEHLPYTGWDTYGDGDDAIQVEYVGGIAVKAIQNGTTYEGDNS